MPPKTRSITVVTDVDIDVGGSVSTVDLQVCDTCKSLTLPEDARTHQDSHDEATRGPRKPPKTTTPEPVPSLTKPGKK